MKFKDHDLIPVWARGSIYNLAKKNIINGSNGYLFNQTWSESEREIYLRNLCVIDKLRVYESQENRNCVEACKPAIVGIRVNKNIGTGSIITPDGYILTNWHVIADAYTKKGDVITQTQDVDVAVLKNRKGYHNEFEKTEVFKAKIIEAWKYYDLALLKIDAEDLHYLTIATRALHEGEKVIAIGHPFGLDFVNHSGYISQDYQNFNYGAYIQTDAIINPGNSGGALVSVETHELVGVPVMKITMVGDTPAEGLGFAVLLKDIREFVLKNNISI